MVAIPKKDGKVRITVNYKKLNAISSLDQPPIPRVDEVLDSLGKGRLFSLFDLVSSFRQITIDKDTIPLTAFCTPTRLFEWLVMPQGSNAAPGRFVKVINEAIKDLDRVAAYLDDVIVYDPGPAAHVASIRSLFERLRKNNLKLSPSKANLGATEADPLGYLIYSSGVVPNAHKVTALAKMPVPKNKKQPRSLLGVIGYYRKILKNLSTRLLPINALLKQGVKFVFTPEMEDIVRQTLNEAATPRTWSTRTGTPSPTASALFAFTATPASTGSGQPSSKNNLAVPSAPSSSSAAPPSTTNGPGSPSTSKPVASSGPSNASVATSSPPSS